jgi:ubiquinone/menaquinone biosynthesis C-methylase UbiE
MRISLCRTEAFDECEMLRSIDDFMIDNKRRCYGWMVLKSGDRVLDVGCGPGLDVQRIHRLDGLTIDVVGVDIRFFPWKQQMGTSADSGEAFVVANAERLPFNENMFDAVWAHRLLQHVDDPIGSLLEIKRVAKPEGRIVLADSDHSSARVFCNDKICGKRLMEFRASTIKNGTAGRMLSTWCKQVSLSVVHGETIDIDIGSLELAGRLGFFFGGWTDKFRLRGRRRGAELAAFLAAIARHDELGTFRFSSKFHMVLARK